MKKYHWLIISVHVKTKCYFSSLFRCHFLQKLFNLSVFYFRSSANLKTTKILHNLPKNFQNPVIFDVIVSLTDKRRVFRDSLPKWVISEPITNINLDRKPDITHGSAAICHQQQRHSYDYRRDQRHEYNMCTCNTTDTMKSPG